MTDKLSFVDPNEPSRFLTVDLALPQRSGHHLARMPFVIALSFEAAGDLRRLSAFERAKVREAIEVHLRNEKSDEDGSALGSEG
jgi:hypothetical protein